MASSRVLFFLVLVACLDIIALNHESAAVADVHIGSCVWGAVDYTSNCNQECQRRGYRGGHCGSFANVNCWCEN